MLGYERVRGMLDQLGYDYIAFPDKHFLQDLQYEDAVPMFNRLAALARGEGLVFGLKLSNTCPVDVKRQRSSFRRDVHVRSFAHAADL